RNRLQCLTWYAMWASPASTPFRSRGLFFSPAIQVAWTSRSQQARSRSSNSSPLPEAWNLAGIINAFVSCSDASNQVAHNLVLTQQGSASGSNRWVVSQPVKCYATTRNSTSGALIVGLETTTLNVGSHAWTVAVSGYLVPQ